MPTTTAHPPGTFCWPELATSDAAAAKEFYGELLGWKFRDTDLGAGGTYTTFTLGGRDAAAGYTPIAKQGEGKPPCWGAYIAVERVDDLAAKVASLGGTVIQPAFDVMDLGRMLVIQDSVGATVCLWQAKQHPGVGVLGEPGALGWTQLNANAPDRAKPFYSGLLGWTFRDDPMPWGGVYTTWMRSDGAIAGGMMPMPPDANAPSHWLSYFVVTDVDRSAAQAAALGARTVVPPTDLPGGGRFAVLGDPQGAIFGIMTAMPA